MGTGIGATAYTSATITRGATIGVKADDTALIQLTPSSDFTQITKDSTTGLLSINFSSLNGNSEFVFGDTAAPNTTNAFTITPSEGHDVTLSYALDGSDPATSNPHVQFEVFSWDSGTSTATSQAIATEETDGTFTATAATTYYVVLTIDTSGVDISTTDLTGTLTITA